MLLEIYLLDLLGTFTFAAFGAYVAMKKKFDIFGIFISSFLTGLGGGTLREVVLGNIPFYFFDYSYVYVVILGTVFSILIYRKFHKIHRYMLVVDAIGLTTFALIGATRAAESNLGGFAIVFFATVTAIGGGLLRDISIRETPQIFYRDFYASPAIFLGLVYAIFRQYTGEIVFVYILITCTFLLRAAAIKFNINLWGPWRSNHKFKPSR